MVNEETLQEASGPPPDIIIEEARVLWEKLQKPDGDKVESLAAMFNGLQQSNKHRRLRCP